MDEQARLRELIVMQLGAQVLQLCELQAKLDAAQAKVADAERRDAERMQVLSDARG